MDKQTKTKQLMKILIGTAWIDGIIQVEERELLNRMVTENNLIDDPEIQSLLSYVKPVSATECYELLEDYLGENYTLKDYHELFESISRLIYSDGDVDIQEAKLLSRLQDLDPDNQANKTVFDPIIKSIQKLYRQAIK
jgi:uncharacterized tellurite resistance protein B-like protein